MSQHGAQALWGRETMAGMADGGLAAYGMPVGGRLVGTPSFGIGAPGHGRDRLGDGLTVAQVGAMHFDLGVYANRRVWARELRRTALEAGSPRAGRRWLLASWGCRAQLVGIGRAGGGWGLLGNRRHACADSPVLASGGSTGGGIFLGFVSG